MQHNIPVESLGPHGQTMAEAVEKCVHWGVCLNTSPADKVLGGEVESAPGRHVII
jgi:glycolate oxidase iron-sulfur subunit